MVRHPSVFLMDEPLSNLDAKLRVTMRAEIKELHRRLGVTFVYVTHDQAEAMTLSDRIAVMFDGELLQVAPPQEIYADPAERRVAEFIGSPKINMIEAGVLEDGMVDLGGRLQAVETGRQPGTTVMLGIRPEAFSLAAPGEPGALSGQVRLVEHLGSDLYRPSRPAGPDRAAGCAAARRTRAANRPRPAPPSGGADRPGPAVRGGWAAHSRQCQTRLGGNHDDCGASARACVRAMTAATVVSQDAARGRPDRDLSAQALRARSLWTRSLPRRSPVPRSCCC